MACSSLLLAPLTSAWPCFYSSTPCLSLRTAPDVTPLMTWLILTVKDTGALPWSGVFYWPRGEMVDLECHDAERKQNHDPQGNVLPRALLFYLQDFRGRTWDIKKDMEEDEEQDTHTWTFTGTGRILFTVQEEVGLPTTAGEQVCTVHIFLMNSQKTNNFYSKQESC